MREMMWEFIKMVTSKGMEQVVKALEMGGGITIFCLLAFFCIAFGVFLNGRCACIYYISPKGKKKLLGEVYIWDKGKHFQLKIPECFLERSDSIYYYMEIPKRFASSHYMEELVLETPFERRIVAVRKRVHFKIGLKKC